MRGASMGYYGASAVIRSGVDVTTPPFDPFTVAEWEAALWVDDPDWTPPSDGDPIVTVPNRGTIGGDFEPWGSSENDPLYRASVPAWNGRPLIDFSSANVGLALDCGNRAQPVTIVMVASLRNSTEQYLFDGYNAPSGNRLIVWATPTSWFLWVSEGEDAGFGTSGPFAPDEDLHLIVARFNEASSSVRIDNGVFYVDPESSESVHPIIFGNNYGTSTTRNIGYLGFAAVYDGLLDPSVDHVLLAGFDAHYGLAGS